MMDFCRFFPSQDNDFEHVFVFHTYTQASWAWGTRALEGNVKNPKNENVSQMFLSAVEPFPTARDVLLIILEVRVRSWYAKHRLEFNYLFLYANSADSLTRDDDSSKKIEKQMKWKWKGDNK